MAYDTTEAVAKFLSGFQMKKRTIEMHSRL